MEDKADGIRTDRRGFLRIASLGTVAGGAALATGVTTETAEAATSESGQMYRETDHIRTYYETARF